MDIEYLSLNKTNPVQLFKTLSDTATIVVEINGYLSFPEKLWYQIEMVSEVFGSFHLPETYTPQIQPRIKLSKIGYFYTDAIYKSSGGVVLTQPATKFNALYAMQVTYDSGQIMYFTASPPASLPGAPSGSDQFFAAFPGNVGSGFYYQFNVVGLQQTDVEQLNLYELNLAPNPPAFYALS